MAVVDVDARDRAFFLEEFRRITIGVAVDSPGPDELDALTLVIDELVANRTRVIVIARDEPAAARIADRLGAEVTWPSPDDGSADRAARFVSRLWPPLLGQGVVVVPSVGVSGPADAADLAVALGLPKLVLTGDVGRWAAELPSFVTLGELDGGLAALDGEPGGTATRRAIRTAVQGGVPSVNVCRLVDLDEELFTFDGAGTLCTARDFLEARPFVIDELPTVEDFVDRGVQQGYLRPRDRAEVGRLLATGVGVHVVGSGHLVGIGSLETAPYHEEQVGEIGALFAAGRFTGGGVGWRLVRALIDRAVDLRCRAVFACTVSPDAETLFERNGFRRVDPSAVPPAKWIGYDAERRRHVRCFWRELDEQPR
jgi:amino-acid N-acetyltransferase